MAVRRPLPIYSPRGADVLPFWVMLIYLRSGCVWRATNAHMPPLVCRRNRTCKPGSLSRRKLRGKPSSISVTVAHDLTACSPAVT